MAKTYLNFDGHGCIDPKDLQQNSQGSEEADMATDTGPTVPHDESDIGQNDDVDMSTLTIDRTIQTTTVQNTEADAVSEPADMGSISEEGSQAVTNSNGKRPAEDTTGGERPPPAKRGGTTTGTRGPKIAPGRRTNANANGTHKTTGKGNMLHAEPGDIAADFARLLVTDVESLQPDSSGISECDTLDTTVLGKVCIMALYLFVASLCLQFCSSCCDQGQDLVACAADGCPIVVCTGEADGTACLKRSEYQGDTWFCPGHNIPFVMKVFSANLMSNVFCILLTPPSSMISCQKILVS
jgi:hypothetical protein